MLLGKRNYQEPQSIYSHILCGTLDKIFIDWIINNDLNPLIPIIISGYFAQDIMRPIFLFYIGLFACIRLSLPVSLYMLYILVSMYLFPLSIVFLVMKMLLCGILFFISTDFFVDKLKQACQVMDIGRLHTFFFSNASINQRLMMAGLVDSKATQEDIDEFCSFVKLNYKIGKVGNNYIVADKGNSLLYLNYVTVSMIYQKVKAINEKCRYCHNDCSRMVELKCGHTLCKECSIKRTTSLSVCPECLTQM